MDEFETHNNQFQDDRNLELAKLLFRSAAWVSAMDDTGGGSSRALEKDAILVTLRGFISEHKAKSLNDVFQLVIEHFLAWDNWSRNLGNFPAELQMQSSSLSKEYKNAMYDLAHSVAVRFRERGALSSFFVGILKSLKNFFVPKDDRADMAEYLNISGSEKNALNELADMLNLPYRVID